MLIKTPVSHDVCFKCSKQQWDKTYADFPTRLQNTFQYSEYGKNFNKGWNNGRIWCTLTCLDNIRMQNTTDEAPADCPYLMEHLVNA
jgi:hypothetical protein